MIRACPLDIIEIWCNYDSTILLQSPLPAEFEIPSRYLDSVAPIDVVSQVEAVPASLIQHLPGAGHTGYKVVFRCDFQQAAEKLVDNKHAITVRTP